MHFKTFQLANSFTPRFDDFKISILERKVIVF